MFSKGNERLFDGRKSLAASFFVHFTKRTKQNPNLWIEKDANVVREKSLQTSLRKTTLENKEINNVEL